MKAGAAEAEDSSVRGDQPVALTVGRRRNADDGPVEREGTSGSMKGGVAEAEDSSVRGDQQ